VLAVGTLRGIHKTGQHPTQVMALLNKRLPLRKIPPDIPLSSTSSSTPSPRSRIFRAPECPVLCCRGQENVEF
jgi:hypothetical protein